MDKNDTLNSKHELIEKILAGARWSGAFRILTQLISWFATIVVVRFISPEDYGLNAMLEAPRELLLLISTVGLDIALMRSSFVNHVALRSAFGWLLVVNIGIFTAYYSSAPFIAEYFGDPKLELMSKVLSFTFLLMPFRVIPNAFLAKELRFKLVSAVELAVGVLTAISTLFLAISGAGIWALIAGVLINRVFLTVALTFFRPWFCLPSLNVAPIRELVKFGGLTTIWVSFVVLAEKLPSLVAGPRLDVEVLGFFAVAMQFAVMPISKLMPVINPIIFPAFSKLRSESAEATHYYGKMFKVIMLIAIPIIFGLASVAYTFVPVIFGKQWQNLVLPLTILSVVMPFRLLTYILRPVSSALGRIDIAIKSAVLSPVILCILLAAFISFGLYGIIAAVVISEVLVALVTVMLFGNGFSFGLADHFSACIPSLVCGLIMCLGLLPVVFISNSAPLLLILVLQIFLGASLYAGALKVIFPSEFLSLVSLASGRK